MSVRLYGRAVGHGSLSVVTAGFREALEGAGLLEGFVALDKSGGDEEQDAPPGALARDGIFTGNLNMVPTMRRNARHERHWVQVTPNSTHVPRQLLAAILDLPNPQILSASSWGTGVIIQTLRAMGVSLRHRESSRFPWVECGAVGSGNEVWVHTMGHGVSGFAPVPDEIEKTRADFAKGEFRVIHFSTTDGERKGTLELVQAWALLIEHSEFPKGAELLLVLDHHAAAALQVRLRDIALPLPRGARILPRGDMDAATMSRVLCRMHLVATPSRGEGFCLPVLESRACGVPVACTATTGLSAGHAQGPGVITIPQPEELGPIDDGPAALTPLVLPLDIAQTILAARTHWESLSHMAQGFAPDVAREWSWQAQLAPLVELLR